MSKAKVEDESDNEFDELDDVLDQFTTPPAVPQPPPVPPNSVSPSVFPSTAPSAKSSTAPEAAGIPGVEDELSLAFQKELMKGMEDLFKGLATTEPQSYSTSSESPSPSAPSSASQTQLQPQTPERKQQAEERDRAMKAIWEAMLVEGMDGGASGGVGDGKGMDVGGMQLGEEFKGSSKPGGDKKSQETGKEQSDFQKTIRATMDKLKGSESNLQSNPESASDPLSALLAQLSSLNLNETGTNSPPNEEEEAELQGLLENMMGQLMSKDVLGDPLTELSEKFPAYLEENKSTLSPDDLKRYESQMECVAKIVAVFKDPNYKDDDPHWNTKVVNLMTEMQSHGSPPAEIMGPLPPGFGIGQDGMPEGCVVG